MVYKHAVVAASAFMLSVVKLLLKGEVGVCALNSHGNYIVDRGKSWKKHGIVFLNFCFIVLALFLFRSALILFV